MTQRFFAGALCTALLFALAGCGGAGSSSSASTAAGSSSPAFSSSFEATGASHDPAEAASVSSQSQSSASGCTPLRKEIDVEAFRAMMDALAVYQPETAGASLKLYVAACGVLNFSEGYDGDQEQALREALEQALDSMDEAQRTALAEAFPAVNGAAQGIVENGLDSVSDILSDAGNPNRYNAYDAERYAQVAALLSEALTTDS